jgi:hypothetical protein
VRSTWGNPPVQTAATLRRGPSNTAVDGRIPVDVSVDHALDFSAEHAGSCIRMLLTM